MPAKRDEEKKNMSIVRLTVDGLLASQQKKRKEIMHQGMSKFNTPLSKLLLLQFHAKAIVRPDA